MLREGTTYMFTVSLKNFGFDPCRFRVKQPPPSTGIQVCYTPGTVYMGPSLALNPALYGGTSLLHTRPGMGPSLALNPTLYGDTSLLHSRPDMAPV